MLTLAIGDNWLLFVDNDDAHIIAIVSENAPRMLPPYPAHNDNKEPENENP